MVSHFKLADSDFRATECDVTVHCTSVVQKEDWMFLFTEVALLR